MNSETMRNGTTFWKFIIFKKGHSKQKGRCPDTLDTPLDPPLQGSAFWESERWNLTLFTPQKS